VPAEFIGKSEEWLKGRLQKGGAKLKLAVLLLSMAYALSSVRKPQGLIVPAASCSADIVSLSHQSTSPRAAMASAHWLAYDSNEAGRYEVYVEPFPGPGGRWQISSGGANTIMRSRPKKELFYSTGNGQGNQLMVVLSSC
jgi:hypothetical protein